MTTTKKSTDLVFKLNGRQIKDLLTLRHERMYVKLQGVDEDGSPDLVLFSILEDAEGDDIYVYFEYDECVKLLTKDIDYIYLEQYSLAVLQSLIEKAEKIYKNKMLPEFSKSRLKKLNLI